MTNQEKAALIQAIALLLIFIGSVWTIVIMMRGQ